jgi:hypothetical protein
MIKQRIKMNKKNFKKMYKNLDGKYKSKLIVALTHE